MEFRDALVHAAGNFVYSRRQAYIWTKYARAEKCAVSCTEFRNPVCWQRCAFLNSGFVGFRMSEEEEEEVIRVELTPKLRACQVTH